MKVGSTKAGVAVLAIALAFALAAPAMAANSVTVNAQVDVDPYSIVLDEGALLDYGMVALGEGGWNPFTRVVVRNSGGSAVRLDMIGTDASNGSGGAWALDPMTNGADQFRWIMHSPIGGPTAVDDVSSSPLLGGISLPSGEAAWLDSELLMPTSTTGYGTYTWSGTIYASAP